MSSTNNSDLGAGPQTILTLKNAVVPADATYGDTEFLTLNNVSLNANLANPIAASGDAAVHLAIDLGDVTGDGSVGGGDAAAIAQVVVGRNTGFQSTNPSFASAQLVDPVIVGDLTGDGTLSGLDAADAAQMFTNPATQPEIPTPLGSGGGNSVTAASTAHVGFASITAIIAGDEYPVTPTAADPDNANDPIATNAPNDATSFSEPASTIVDLPRVASEAVNAIDSKSETATQKAPLSIVPLSGRIDVEFDARFDPINHIIASPSPNTSLHLKTTDDWYEQFALDFNHSNVNRGTVRQSAINTEAMTSMDWDELSGAIDLLYADL
jgi:hypothetical protein